MNSSRSFQWKSACPTPAFGRVTFRSPRRARASRSPMSSHWKNIGTGRPIAAITSDGIRQDHRALYSASIVTYRYLSVFALCSAFAAHRPARSLGILRVLGTHVQLASVLQIQRPGANVVGVAVRLSKALSRSTVSGSGEDVIIHQDHVGVIGNLDTS